MTNEELQLKVQAFVDGELSEREASEVASLTARDSEVNDLVRTIRHTRQALAGYLDPIRLPESREFFWSKIERELRALPAEEPPAVAQGWTARLWRWCIPAGVACLLALAGFIGLKWIGSDTHPIQVQASLADSGAVTYRDYEAGMTVVWFSYPPEAEMAEFNPSPVFD